MPGTRTYAFARDARSNRIVIVLLATGFAALITAALVMLAVQQRSERDGYWVAHTLAVQSAVNGFVRQVERAETARRGILIDPGGDFRPVMDRALADAHAALGRIRALTVDNPAQQRRIAPLGPLLAAFERQAHASLALPQAVRRADFRSDAGVSAIRAMRRGANAIMAEEARLLIRRVRAQQQTQRVFYTTMAVCGALIVVISVATLVIVRRNLRALDRSRRQLHVLNEQLEDLVEARTAQLRRANAEIQRFAYIVSHDLRAPLVNVMGFTAELEAARATLAGHLSAEADAGRSPPGPVRVAVEEDLPEAIGFIRTSTQKMDRLINAILRLSREGRRTLAPAQVDLAALVHGIVDSLRHRIDEAGVTVSTGPLPVVETDRLAVEQILSNLIENALKYLQPGRPGTIAITATAAGGQVRIAVRDNGRGIEPRDHERIFDLFRRAGTQDQPGEGIGLAHVRALAYRLGGLVEVQSAPGAGSTFTLVLPRQFTSGDGDV